MTKQTAQWMHSLLTAAGTGAATFLTATFATGLPTTAATWRALLIGCAAAVLSRVFGWCLNRLQTTAAAGSAK
jgi:hypothetical protein